MMEEDYGRDNPALAKAEPVARLGPSGFDPARVERVARAIAANKRVLTVNDPEVGRVWNGYCGQARAALAADDSYLAQENADLIHDLERQMTIANIECNRAEDNLSALTAVAKAAFTSGRTSAISGDEPMSAWLDFERCIPALIDAMRPKPEKRKHRRVVPFTRARPSPKLHREARIMDIVEQAEAIIGRAIKTHPHDGKQGLVLSCAQAEAAVVDALKARSATIESLQAEVEDLKHDLDRYMKIANIECNRAERFREALEEIAAREDVNCDEAPTVARQALAAKGETHG